MGADTEKKIFLSVLWAFLCGAIVFFIVYISSGRIVLPPSLWLMLLLLDAGFIVFLFIPLPGRSPAGRAESEQTRRWYPRSLADIVDKPAAGDGTAGLRRPTGAVAPVPLIPLVILLVVIGLATPLGRGRDSWQQAQTRRLLTIYDAGEERLAGIEAVMRRTADGVAELLGGAIPRQTDLYQRARLMRTIDSLATAAARGIEPFGEIGIQVITYGGERPVWGGRPRYQGPVERNSKQTRIHIARTRLFTLLVYDLYLSEGMRLVIDCPLAVNYRISNRFLESENLGDALARRHGVDVEYSFWMGAHGGRLQWEDETLRDSRPHTVRSSEGRIMIRGLLTSAEELPLARLTVSGGTYEAELAARNQRRALWAGLLLALCVTVIARWCYRGWGRRRRAGESPAAAMLRQTAVLLFFLALIRYLLLRLEIPGVFFGANLFDPALFADAAPAGLLRTAGDFLLTMIFMLLLVFGALKAFRTYYGGYMERPLCRGKPFSPLRLIVKAALVAAVLAAAGQAASGIVARTVLNSNPRLIGLDAGLFTLPVLTIHMSLLLATAALFIAAVFFCRLVLAWGGGTWRELLPAAAAALGGILLFAGLDGAVVAAIAVLLLLSIRIFPLLRKEEFLSVVFASFLLVLICSLVVYGVAAREYDALRRARVIERAQEFNYPEDSWLQVVLPDLVQELSRDRSIASKILARSETVAFETWAGSELSAFGLSCIFDVFDASGERVSRFSAGVPVELAAAFEDAGGEADTPGMIRMRRGTDQGEMRYFVGIAPVHNSAGVKAGRIEVKVPYFHENPAMLTGAGPGAPEILRNIERGSVAPRVDEPERLLVARTRTGRVVDTSSPALKVGTDVPAPSGEWFVRQEGGERYRCIYAAGEGDGGYVVGYMVTGRGGAVLQWAAVASIYILLTLVALAVLLAVRRLPVLGSVTPDVTFRGGLGFRRKLLLSFTTVAIIPVILMGLFAGRYIRQRYDAEGEREAYEAAAAAGALVKSEIRKEAQAFAGAAGDSLPAGINIERLRALAEANAVTVSRAGQALQAGVVIPQTEPHGGEFQYFRRRLDDEFIYFQRPLNDVFIGGVAAVLGRNVNVYYGGELVASSERGLFVGGFLFPLLSPAVHADIALGGARTVVTSETLGGYSYRISSTALAPLGAGENAVISVPHLYRSAEVDQEVARTSTVILGLLALIFCIAVTSGFLLAGAIFKPVAALRVGTRRIMRGDLEFRLEPGPPDEIGDLVDSFNTMTEALREAQRNLFERQRYLEAILDNIATGVVSSGRDGTIVTLNPSGERILGLSSERVIGRSAAEAAAAWPEGFFRLFEGAGHGVTEREVTLESGGLKRTLKAVVAGLEEGGEHLGTVIVFDDLTELIRSKKLAAWIEMARQIAHEVKNPLTPIKISAQLMRRAYDERREEFDEIFTGGIETVMQQTEILRRIASEFSSFGRTLDLRPERIELEPFVAGIVAGYRGAPQALIEHSADPGIAVNADREALRRILVNLIENSLEAMPQGGTIGISCRRAGAKVEIRVVDTGIGLAPEVQERLFEPYFSTKTTGTGLGLAICQRFAREMEGEIVMRNRRDVRGVETVVTLPGANGENSKSE